MEQSKMLSLIEAELNLLVSFSVQTLGSVSLKAAKHELYHTVDD